MKNTWLVCSLFIVCLVFLSACGSDATSPITSDKETTSKKTQDVPTQKTCEVKEGVPIRLCPCTDTPQNKEIVEMCACECNQKKEEDDDEIEVFLLIGLFFLIMFLD